MRSKHLPRMLAVCVALVLAATACGGDDDGDATSTTLARRTRSGPEPH